MLVLMEVAGSLRLCDVSGVKQWNQTVTDLQSAVRFATYLLNLVHVAAVCCSPAVTVELVATVSPTHRTLPCLRQASQPHVRFANHFKSNPESYIDASVIIV